MLASEQPLALYKPQHLMQIRMNGFYLLPLQALCCTKCIINCMVCTMQSSGGGFDKKESARVPAPHSNPHKTIVYFLFFVYMNARCIIFSCDENPLQYL